MSLASEGSDSQKAQTCMPSTGAKNTVFAFFVRNLEVEISYPMAVAVVAVCAVAWVLTVIDIRRSTKPKANPAPPSLDEVDREFARLIRRR